MRHRAGRRATVLLGCVLGGVLLAFLTVVLDRDVVAERSAAGLSVELGWPLAFVEQQQGIDPPLPYVARLRLPQESPTTLDVAALGVDVLAYAAALLLLVAAVRRVRARRRADRAT